MIAPNTPAQHAELLHPVGAVGRPVIVWRDGGKWRSLAVKVDELAEALASYAGMTDVYLSQNRFWGHRRVVAQVAQLDACFIDVDFYRIPSLADRPAFAVLELILHQLEEAVIPAPSFAVDTGRGLALVWLLYPVPRQALPRWNAVQKHLAHTLRDVGADPMARDAARFLRLVGTVNSKNRRLVETLDNAGTVWDFDTFADEVLPMTREEIQAARKARAEARTGARLWTPTRELTAGRLWEARLEDLQTLLNLRWFGQLPPGERDAWMFFAGVAMSWLVEAKSLRRELFHLAREVTQTGKPWTEQETKTRLYAVMERAGKAAKGQSITWQGAKIDPRYRLRTATIVDALGISPAEMEQMRTLIDSDQRAERNRKREELRRRQAGAMERKLYTMQATQRGAEVHRLRQEGWSVQRIAEHLHLSQRHVYRLLTGDVLATAAADEASTTGRGLFRRSWATGPTGTRGGYTIQDTDLSENVCSAFFDDDADVWEDPDDGE